MKFRMLKKGEEIKLGDEFTGSHWEKVCWSIGLNTTHPDLKNLVFRRPIQPKRKTKEGKKI